MSENYLELAIIAFIAAGIIVAIWKGGQANPVGTGSLNKRLGKIESSVAALKDGEKKLATKADVKQVSDRLDGHDGRLQDVQSSVDEVKGELGEIRENAASRNSTLDHVRAQVDRLYDHIVSKGMNS